MTRRPLSSKGGVGFPAHIRPYRSALDEELERLVAGRDEPLQDMMRHQLGREGGRVVSPGAYIHSGLLLLACEACGGDWRQALPAAAALELLHNSLLVHDDIRDESPGQRGRPTVWWQWGAAQAINAGDGLYTLARLAPLDLDGRGVAHDRILAAARLLDQTCLEVRAGQYDELVSRGRPSVTSDEYEEMALSTAGAVFACALGIGAVVAAGQGGESRRLGDAGRALGAAHQMQGDVLDLWGSGAEGVPAGNGLRRGKKGLPVVLGLSHAEGAEADRLRALCAGPVDDAAVREVTAVLDGMGIRDLCAEAANRHWERCVESLRGSGLDDTDATRLIDACGTLVDRGA